MPVTLKDIAEVASVSTATVSMALNDSPKIKAKTKRQIKEIADELGYRPNIIAKNLARRSARTIGLIVPDIESVYYSKVVRNVDESVRKYGFHSILAISNNSQRVEKEILEDFVAQRVSGVLVAPTNGDIEDISYYSRLADYNIPYVFLTSTYSLSSQTPFVMADLSEGAYRSVKYILELGHRKILFMSVRNNPYTIEMRKDGYHRALGEYGIDYNSMPTVMCDYFSYFVTCRTIKHLLLKDFDYTAIVTLNDEMASGVIHTLMSSGIKVPEQVSVIGYDNTFFSVLSYVPVTTIKQDLRQISFQATNMLIDYIQGRSVNEKQVLLEPQLIVRESTCRPPQ